jgi:hypothetical protein
MPNFRYVLVLDTGDRQRVMRHSSHQPLHVGEPVQTATHGEWVVTKIVTSDDATFRDGVVHCKPAASEDVPRAVDFRWRSGDGFS